MSMLTVWTLWEIMSVTVLQDTLEMEHTALVRTVVLLFLMGNCPLCYGGFWTLYIHMHSESNTQLKEIQHWTEYTYPQF